MITYNIEQTVESEEYLEDVISADEFKKWKKGDKVLINGTTGIGKSYFLLTRLYDSFKSKRDILIKVHPDIDFSDRKILFLTNRNALKDQLEVQYGEEVNELVQFMNYQELITLWKMQLDIPNYDFIVADECHYFFSDANFSSDSDIALRYLLEERNDALIVYLSATPKLLIEYLNNTLSDQYFTYAYKLKKGNRISRCCLWKVEEQLIRELKKIPANEKVLYFRNDILKNVKLKEKYSDEQFLVETICSTSDSKNKRFCCVQELNNIRDDECFDCKMLISTTVIDNGVSISDINLKHIVLDNILDLDIAAQCIGRKRFVEDEDITLYLRIPHQDTVQKSIKDAKEHLDIINTLNTQPIDTFCRRYGRDDLEGMVYPIVEESQLKYIVNDIKQFKFDRKLLYLNNLYDGDSRTYAEELFAHMEANDIETYYLWDNIIQEVKDNLRPLVNKKLFDGDKSLIADAINIDGLSIIEPSKQKKKYNDFFSEHNMHFNIRIKTEGSGPRRGKKYWVLEII